MTSRLVVVSAGLSNPSSTRLLAERLTEATGAALGGEVVLTHVELRDLAHQLSDRLLTGFPAAELAAAEEAVRFADGLIVVTPVFSASYSGLFKTFFDVVEDGVLDGTPVLIAATAGSARHSLVLDHALRPLFSYLRAVVVPTGVFAATDDFAGTDLGARIHRAAAQLAALMAAAAASGTIRPGRGGLEESLAAVTPFEQLLRGASRPDAVVSD